MQIYCYADTCLCGREHGAFLLGFEQCYPGTSSVQTIRYAKTDPIQIHFLYALQPDTVSNCLGYLGVG